MSVTATELKNNLSYYLILAGKEDVFITKNGKTIAKLTSPYQEKLDLVEELFGSVPRTVSLEEEREERLSEFEDAMMCMTAERMQLDCIITRNLKDYEKAHIPVLTPEAFLQKV